jgi:hypothetical protein
MFRLAELDPFGGLDRLEKFSHHFIESQRFRVKADGRCGRIENFNARQNVNVCLDSGHLVQCMPDEIEPEDWDSGERMDAGMVRGLVAAIEAGAVSAHDLGFLKGAAENIAAQRGRDPFGLGENADHSTLRIMCEK